MPQVTIRPVKRKGHELVFEEPKEDAHYILGADVAQGATFGVVNEASDWSTLSIWRREPYHLIQVAELRSRADNFAFGLMVATWGRKYNYALVNVERNLAHGVIAGLRSADYPMDRWFRPPVHASVQDGLQMQWFFHKNRASQRILMDTLKDYTAERLMPFSQPLLDELSSLRRSDYGEVDTNGKDLAIACAMAVIADATEEMPDIQIRREEKQDWIDPSRFDTNHFPETRKQTGDVGFNDVDVMARNRDWFDA